jgi:hypothetical protein
MAEDVNVQRHLNKLIFNNQDLDYYFQSVPLGFQTYGGASAGEVVNVAMKIRQDETPENWIKEWTTLAQSVENRAKKSLEQGHRRGAREAFLTALTYYRTAIFAIRGTDKRYAEVSQNMQSCLRAAAPLFDPPIEMVEFPYQGKKLPGFFMPAASDGKKHPTLIMVGGGETFAPELYFWSGATTGRERGYNVVAADMPGQGQRLWMDCTTGLILKFL